VRALADIVGHGQPSARQRGRGQRQCIDRPDIPGREQVFVEYNGNAGIAYRQRGIVTLTHKYIHNDGHDPEPYDPQADPHETTNLCRADPPPPQADELRRRLGQWMRESGDDLRLD